MFFSVFIPFLIFLVGVLVLIYSVEELVENITKTAILGGVSTFILAVIFAGMDFENWVFGIASILGGLPGIAIGSAFGSAYFLVGVAVAVAGLISPFEVEVDKDYLFLMLASPLLVLPFLLNGSLTRLDGGLLLLIFGSIIYYIYREERKGRETFRDEETEEAIKEIRKEEHGRSYYLLLVAIYLVGIIIGSELAVRGAKGIVSVLKLSQTIFGMTFVGAVMSLEEILLVLEPVRKERPSIAVGNILGSLIFFSTGNIGLIAITKSFYIDPLVLSFYWPILLISTVITAIFLYKGKIKRLEALLLGILYVIYWIANYNFL
ncbi:MAG: Ca2+/Na+ antiporter [Candidatus Methanohalarchaeum thermophilum]|uniref:Ca2+/Na+ antiporter n=1 Tax=Methanohalarchaeum thermophilum TaxID=1903181 RepID=A0A1Q6DTX5_METT1|nr:MAG: Ca2+/Na+ antiporter [Candidatus Methanohalarchaeum thermophilum]